MYSSSFYLLSGANTISTGESSVLGMDKFSISLLANNFSTSVPPTGIVEVESRLDGSSNYVSVFKEQVSGVSTGILIQLDGPLESIRASVTQLNDANFTGSYSVISRHSSYSR